MKSYNYFAEFYDDLTENVDYKVRSEYISGFFNKYGLKDDAQILDLACGTGSFALELLNKGYSVTGIDKSPEMLTIADNKLKGKVNLINTEMQNFTLTESVDAVICMLDSVNHLESENDISKCFKCVYNSLNKNGLFIFDVNTVYKHNYILADNSFVFDEENYFLSWDNELLDNNRVRILLDIFHYNGTNYDRYSEEFTETAYDTDCLIGHLTPYFDVLGVYDDLSLKKPEASSERLYFVCKRR